MLRIAEHFHDSDLGRQRQGNEDNYYVRAPLFVVADGMGGAQAGEVASAIAVEQFEQGLPDGEDPGEALAALIRAANTRIHEQARSDAHHAGMGTTTTAAYLAADSVVVAHVGDSRCYRIRGGGIQQMTRDHSLLEDYKDAKPNMSEDEQRKFPHKNVITRALGMRETVQVDVLAHDIQDNDVFLLCSDGLSGMIEDAKIMELVKASADLELAVSSLVEAANEAGGTDNITVLALQCAN